jgi:HEAT repeat protein
MSRARWLLPALCLALAAAARGDERLLRASDYPSGGAGLLDVFRGRTPTPAAEARARALLRQCGSEEFADREKASADLVALGPQARPLLRAALADADPEVARRAADALVALTRPDDPACLEAAARLLGHRRPDGAAAVLLAYLPYAEEPALADEIAAALARAGVRGGRPDPDLVRALGDRRPLVRAVAAEALTRGGAEGQRDAVRKLLADPDPAVRERVALTLLDAQDREAVPALIRLAGELPRSRRDSVEGALYALAGDKAPPAVPGDEAEDRRQRRAGWEEWWRANGTEVRLPKVEPGRRLLGHTVLTVVGLGRGPGRAAIGRVIDVDAAGQVRWEVGGLRYPVDAQVLGPDRVLVVEYTDRTVSERTLGGETLWARTLDSYALSARRLPSGRTFIVTRSQVLETDREGRDEELVARPGDIAGAVRLPNRRVVVVTTDGQCVFYDAGREARSFALSGGTVQATGFSFEVLPNGNVLVPHYPWDKVVEYDPEGRAVWEASVRSPGSAQRLPNGNTLVTSRFVGRAGSVLEVDREGQAVQEYRQDGRVLKAQRR